MSPEEFWRGIATMFAIASFLYGLFGVIALLDDHKPSAWVRIASWISVSWPVLWAVAEWVRRNAV